MNDRMTAAPRANGCVRRHGLEVGQAIELRRGVLAGLRGVLIGFRGDHNCLIELDVVQRRVVLILSAAAVKERAESASDEVELMSAQSRG